LIEVAFFWEGFEGDGETQGVKDLAVWEAVGIADLLDGLAELLSFLEENLCLKNIAQFEDLFLRPTNLLQ
jgi:hypothetical protein